MTKIKDIAKKLNLSVSTISKGLSGATDISEDTRQMILNTALEMGYTPKKRQSQAGGKDASPVRVCVLIENMGYDHIGQFGYEIIVGFRLAAASKQWTVDIVPLALGSQFDSEYEEYMLKNQYSAGFLLGFTLHSELLRQLERTRIPTVLLDNVVQNPVVTCVGIDNQGGISAAVEHLASLGHKHIALLNGEACSRVAHERMDGFRMGLERCGLPFEQELVVHDDFHTSAEGHYAESFLRKGATGIVCASDLLAHSVLAELYRMKIAVPDRVSVTGFDDIPLSKYTTPPLTTIRQDRLAIGRSVCLAMEQIMERNTINRILLMPELVVRDSTGQARSGGFYV